MYRMIDQSANPITIALVNAYAGIALLTMCGQAPHIT